MEIYINLLSDSHMYKLLEYVNLFMKKNMDYKLIHQHLAYVTPQTWAYEYLALTTDKPVWCFAVPGSTDWFMSSEPGPRSVELATNLVQFPGSQDTQYDSWNGIMSRKVAHGTWTESWQIFRRTTTPQVVEGNPRSLKWMNPLGNHDPNHDPWNQSMSRGVIHGSLLLKIFKTFPLGQFHPFLTIIHLNYNILSSLRRE